MGIVSTETCRFCGCGSSIASIRSQHRFTCGTALDAITREVIRRGTPCMKIESHQATIEILQDQIKELEDE